jgi:L-fucose isomerase-like protein
MAIHDEAGAWRPRVGVLSAYFSLFDEQMPPEFGASREAAAQACVDVLARHFEVVYPGLLTSEEEGARAGRALGEAHAVVVAPPMAAPPSYVAAALRAVAAPVVVWNPGVVARFPPGLTQTDAIPDTGQVGAVMVANALRREGRPFAAVTAAVGEEDQLVRTVRAAAAAGALRGTIALRIGDPIPGYIDVEATAEELDALGVVERAVSVEELNEAFDTAAPEQAEGDERSTRLAAALSALVDEHGVVCGTVNCHSAWFRSNPKIGIAACLGVSQLAERGVSFSCTGDQPTALALLLARRLTGRALYSEFYAPESESGHMLLGAGGEGDPAWADPAHPVRIVPNHHYPGVNGEGSAVSFQLRPGPATVLSLSPAAGGWRLAWATGEVVPPHFPEMGGPNGMFRFDSGTAEEAGARWIASGATHHNALAPGRLDVEIPVLADALGIEAIRV